MNEILAPYPDDRLEVAPLPKRRLPDRGGGQLQRQPRYGSREGTFANGEGAL